MSGTLSVREVLARAEKWDPEAAHIFTGLARVRPPEGLTLSLSDPVFTMGSCFARGIEAALRNLGGNVVSMDERIRVPAFWDGAEHRDGYFHRFTPQAILLEWRRCFGEVDWTDDTLIFERRPGWFVDFHYWSLAGLPTDRASTLERRRIAGELVATAAEAKVVILTLGLTESWVHRPTGLHANRIDPKIVVHQPDDWAFHNITYEETLECLEGVAAILRRINPEAQLVITVSPVPLGATFSGQDLITANMASKATLRAAAAAFCERSGALYFPSYEIVTHSDPARVWVRDGAHVHGDVVDHVMRTFLNAYATDAPATLPMARHLA
jgi:hypothetical protein